ncbi:MAG: hypothetical protein BGO98_49610 [Myxococcales bacterium 68-20]|nr:RecX family transcriptional regulator [Myxococcales bacterium]OJY29873.1 MAG: hypothetical protein BGO98_49610 [Myxococcales bacterium 68-20]
MRFREVGLVNDAAYAESRARSLSRVGRSRRAISAHLAAKGVDAETVRQALPHDAGVELAFARKRRIGPYAREGTTDREAKQKASPRWRGRASTSARASARAGRTARRPTSGCRSTSATDLRGQRTTSERWTSVRCARPPTSA